MSEMLEYSFGLLLKASITSEGDGIIVSKAIVNTLGKCAYLVDYLLEPESIISVLLCCWNNCSLC